MGSYTLDEVDNMISLVSSCIKRGLCSIQVATPSAISLIRPGLLHTLGERNIDSLILLQSLSRTRDGAQAFGLRFECSSAA